MLKSHSYPERLYDASNREIKYLKDDILTNQETLQKFREKDHIRTEHLAELGSTSSTELIIRNNWKFHCCRSISRVIDYILEREEETRNQDRLIETKSYAGFYYFIKWFVRSLFFLIFTTLGTIAGKEVGCEIRDHDSCNTGVVELVDGSPHIIASIIGLVCGLLIGQWVGRFIWDNLTNFVRRCLRKTEKLADQSKIFLILLSLFIYGTVTTSFSVIFFFFVKIGNNNIIGAVIGGCIGLFCALLAYGKASNCRSGEIETPMVSGSTSLNQTITPPELIV